MENRRLSLPFCLNLRRWRGLLSSSTQQTGALLDSSPFRKRRTYKTVMPPKKNSLKQRSPHSVCNEVANRQHVMSIQEGADIVGTCSVETFPHEAPKACEIFSQFCVPAANPSEKSKGKQSTIRMIQFKRLSSTGVQFGETGTATSKLVPVSELDGEFGAASQGVGTISICRSGDSLDCGNFFICMTDDPTELRHLSKHYIAFGRISSGLDVLVALSGRLLPFCGNHGVVDNTECPFQIADVFPTA